MGGARAKEAQANKDRASAITGAIGGVASGLSSFAGGAAKKAGMNEFLSGTGGNGTINGSYDIIKDYDNFGQQFVPTNVPQLTSGTNFNQFIKNP